MLIWGFLSVIGPFSKRIVVFLLAFCGGLISSRLVNAPFETQPGIKSDRSSYSAIFLSRPDAECEHQDVFAARRSASAVRRLELGKGLAKLRSRLSKLERRWTIPEFPTDATPELFSAYHAALDRIPAEHLSAITQLRLEISIDSILLQTLENEFQKEPQDLLYRERCTQD